MTALSTSTSTPHFTDGRAEPMPDPTRSVPRTSSEPVSHVPAALAILAGTLSLQFGATIARLHFDTVGPIGATLLRLLFATAILLVVLRPKVWRWSPSTWRAAILLGLALGAMNQFIYLSIDRIPVGVAITIEFLGPLTLALVQLRRWFDGVWALLALVGVVLVSVQSVAGVGIVGVLFAFCAAACWAAYILASANLGKAMPGTEGLAISMLVATITAIPLGAASAGNAIGDPALLGVFVLVAVMSSAVPYAIELRALRTMPTRVFGVLQSMGPAAAAIAGLVVLQQRLTVQEIVALLIITVASVGITLRAPSSPKDVLAAGPV